MVALTKALVFIESYQFFYAWYILNTISRNSKIANALPQQDIIKTCFASSSCLTNNCPSSVKSTLNANSSLIFSSNDDLLKALVATKTYAFVKNSLGSSLPFQVELESPEFSPVPITYAAHHDSFTYLLLSLQSATPHVFHILSCL